MSHSKKIFRNIIFGFGSRIITILLGFVTRKLFIIFLSDELLGLNSLLTDLLGLLNLADMGLGTALMFNLYKPIAEKDEEKTGRILNAAKRIYNVVGVGMIVAGIVLSLFIQYLIKDNPYDLNFLRIVFIINVISSASSYFYVHKRLFMITCEDIHLTNIVDIIMSIAGSVLKIAAVAVFKNYYLFVIIGAVQAFASNLFVNFVCNKKYPYLKKVTGYTKSEMSALFANIKQLIPNKISNYVFSNTDNTIISAFVGLSGVTLYTNYSSIVLQVFIISTMVTNIFKVSFGNVFQESADRAKHIFFLHGYQLLQFFYSSICGVAMFCLLDDFVRYLYGSEYVISVYCVIVLTVDFYIRSMYQPLSMMLEVLGEFKSLKNQEIFSMILNIVVSVGLVIPFGIVGPIIGTLTVDIFTTIFRFYSVLYKYYREYFGEYVKKMIGYGIVFIAQYVILYFALQFVVLDSKFIQIIVKGIICCVVVIASNILIYRKTDEFAYLKSRFIKRRG